MTFEQIEREGVLRDLLRGHWQVFPAMVFGMLGGDPNNFTVYEHAQIAAWLEGLGYERRVLVHYQHAEAMSVWRREEVWPGERFEDRRPYAGIPLKEDPDFREERREALARKRAFLARLDELYGKG